MIDCNEWKTEKHHECTNMGKVKHLNYDGSCTSHDFQFGTLEISGRLIFVEQRVPTRCEKGSHLKDNVLTSAGPLSVFQSL